MAERKAKGEGERTVNSRGGRGRIRAGKGGDTSKTLEVARARGGELWAKRRGERVETHRWGVGGGGGM